MVMELGDRNLEQDIFMRKKKEKYYTLEEVEEFCSILINFFACLQRKGYLHRDIKPDNILLMSPANSTISAKSSPSTSLPPSQFNPKFKVCDFGFAIKHHEFSDKNIAGTANYASPKIQNKFKNS